MNVELKDLFKIQKGQKERDKVTFYTEKPSAGPRVVRDALLGSRQQFERVVFIVCRSRKPARTT